MSEPEFQFGWLSDPRLAAQALSPTPAWLWSADAPRLLWANPVGAAIFEAASPAQVTSIVFEPQHQAAAQVARLAATLPQAGAPRLERLRGFGAAFGGTLICLCSRVILADNAFAILMVATERSGKDLALPERAHRLLADCESPAAIFTADGELIESTPAARERFGPHRDLVALGAEALAREATLDGRAAGEIEAGPVALLKLGAGPTVALLLDFTGPAKVVQSETPPAGPKAIASPPTVPAAVAAEPVPPRRQPFRFVWQMDAATCFTLGTQEFAMLLGPKTAAVLDRPWAEIAQALELDPGGQISQALGARDTWSGIVLQWPVDGDDGDARLPIEMSGLPVFDRDRQFAGFRGFGICRDVERLEALQRKRAESSPPSAAAAAKAEAPEGNVLPFPLPPPAPAAVAEPETPAAEEVPALSPGEHSAFRELARELSERLKNPPDQAAAANPPDATEPAIAAPPQPEPPKAARNGDAARDIQEARPILDRLPVGVLVYRLNSLVYANRAFLDWTGYVTLDALTEAGGLDSLFIETQDAPSDAAIAAQNGAKTLSITTVNGQQKPVEGRLFSVAWNNENALVLMINTQVLADDGRAKAAEAALRRLEAENHELKTVLETATDGVLMLDRAGRVLSANRSAEALFGYDAAEFTELLFGDLFAPESRRTVLDYLDRLAYADGARMLDTGREAVGRVKQGGQVPLYVTIGRVEDGEKLCVVLRDITVWKRTEDELIAARQEAEKASSAKSEFLAKISHEIRTPLNAIIGFSEMMMDERFGVVGNERYRQYLRDIHASGGHLISLLNDLLDLSKIEAGKLDLTFVSVDLHSLVPQCVGIMQEQANRERVIIRTSLPSNLPPIVADAKSVRQITLNLLSNSIKFTGAGGQVIVSAAVNDDNEVALRVRDTGVGMSEKELQTALEPFRQLATSARWGSGGTGLGLPITKALAEANHARFRITSQVDDGTLVEVAFPAMRMLAQ